jgi:diaminopimelate epimerase
VLVLDADGELALSSKQIAKICDRRFGIGADGFIRVVKSAKLPEGKEILAIEPAAVWFMDYYNADGNAAEMCGNGVRIFARYLLDRGLAKIEGGSTLAVGTRAGVKDLTQGSNGFAVDLGRWKLTTEFTVEAKGIEVARPGQGIEIGNPHVVVALSSDTELRELKLFEAPVVEPKPENGANVEFVVPSEPMIQNGVGYFSFRVHERGVGETLSCGTGIAAAALATRYWAGASAPNQWQVQALGGLVAVRMFATEDGEHVSISGPAELTFDGEINLASL